MLKIENCGCHGNESEKMKKICTFVHLLIEVKNWQNFKKIYFFYFSLVENQNNLELDFKVFFIVVFCCLGIVIDESN